MRLPPLDNIGSKSRIISDMITKSKHYGLQAYSITLSNNLAKTLNSMDEYLQIAKQLPSGSFIYVIEKSKYNKYHLHGVLLTTCHITYRNIMSARESSIQQNEFTELVQTYFGSHIRYDILKTPEDFLHWVYYMSKCPDSYPFRIEIDDR